MATSAVGHAAEAEDSAPGRAGQRGSSRQPNLILFMPDEMRADALACYGNPVTKTPNFDRLARGGTRFANCHVQFPVCGASRCSLLTGWPTSVRGHRSLSYFLRPEEPNLFRYLRQAGYDVFWYGKNDALAAQCFYDSVTMWNYPKQLPGAFGASSKQISVPAPEQTDDRRTFIRESIGDRRSTHDYWCVQSAIRILERKEKDRPFCLFLPLSSPHPPYGAPEGFHDMYGADQIHNLIPPNLPRRPNYMQAIRKAYHIDTLLEKTFRRIRALYYGMVSYSDWLVGEMLEALEKTNHAANTAVFVLSDHGDYAGDYGLVEKWSSGQEDDLTHVPLIARVPGGTPNHTAAEMVELFDVMETCLELAGTRAQHTHFARSLLPQVHGGNGDPKRAAFTEGGFNLYEPQCFEGINHEPPTLYYPKEHLERSQPDTVTRVATIRSREYKLVARPQGQSELYVLREDPRCLNNRFGESGVSGIQAQMQQRLLYWYLQTSGIAPFDKDQRDFPPFNPTPEFAIQPALKKILDETT
jgi:choline-sulfatase